MKWLSLSYWWLLLMGKSTEQKASVKRGRPKGSKNKPRKNKTK